MLALTFAATVHISVLGSFHPTALEVQPARRSVVVVNAQGRDHVLEGTRTFTIDGPARVSGMHGAPTRFRLGIPGRVHREYIGRLEVRRQGSGLLALLEMDPETAVAAIIEAEDRGVPFEARKAQAIVTRSFLLGARGRHAGFDFCDTEHCQLLRDPAPLGSIAARATAATRGLVLAYKGQIVPALYSANCGGHTRGLGPDSESNYPFFSVACPLKGPRRGHGVGLCQTGALDLARHGYPVRVILGHYFPDTTIERLETAPRKQVSTVGVPHAAGVPQYTTVQSVAH
jgi:hypothetical protein